MIFAHPAADGLLVDERLKNKCRKRRLFFLAHSQARRGSLTVKKKKNIQRFRDGVKRVAFGTSFTIIALEHQDKIHRGMPVRIMVEDALSYDRQMKKIQKQNREKGVLDKND